MNRKQLLAAETFSYSFNKYAEKVEMRAERFTKLMPADIDILEKSRIENWSLEQLSEALEMDMELAVLLQQNYSNAREIFNAPTPAESFRRGVPHSIRHELKEGLKSDADIERLVVQICYRAADLSYLLDIRNEELSKYSEELRAEP